MNDEPFAATALWSRRLGLFAIPVVLIALLAQRSGRVAYDPAVAALGASAALAALAILLGLAALAVIWVRGNQGAGSAALGVLAGVLVLAGPAFYVGRSWQLPALTDISTDPTDPPAFVFAAAERRPEHNPVRAPSDSQAVAQLAAYPDIQPLRVSQPPDETHALALQLAQGRGWRILDSGYTSRRIEAVTVSPILKLVADVVIEVTADGSGTRVDMRSTSRAGRRDFGENAARIRAFLSELAAAAR